MTHGPAIVMLASALGWAAWSVWLAVAAVGIMGSALFSGLETGVYRLNRVRLHLRAHAPGSSAAVLQAMVRNPNRLLGTLLYGNNVANYLASYAIAVLLAAQGLSDWAQVVINAALLTPLLFVFGEVLPKDLFANFSDRLTYWFARFLRFTQIILTLTGLVPLIDLVSRIIQRVAGVGEISSTAFHPRVAMNQLIKEGLGQGIITNQQSDMIDRVLHPTEQTVHDAMIEWADVICLRTSQPIEAVWALSNRVPHTRFPLLDEQDEPVGIIHMLDVLLRKPEDCPSLASLAHPAPRLTPETSIRDALLTLQERRSAMGIVFRDDQPVGIVTLKDLVEPIVGELTVW